MCQYYYFWRSRYVFLRLSYEVTVTTGKTDDEWEKNDAVLKFLSKINSFSLCSRGNSPNLLISTPLPLTDEDDDDDESLAYMNW